MKLEDIGFYTLSDKRARESCPTSRMMRCEMLITDKCNFSCPYCRGFSGNMTKGNIPGFDALETIIEWVKGDLQSIRFSGGEPLTHPRLEMLVDFCHAAGIENIAVSTNGGATFSFLKHIEEGTGEYSYPAAIQTPDGLIHLVYSYRKRTIKYIFFNEEWLFQAE